MITIVNYGMGNLGSIHNMFKYLGIPAQISASESEIANAEKLLLPGVGAFDAAMQKLNSSGLKEVLDHKVLVEKKPVLGICLGMQLLTNKSEEGSLKGLGWIDAETVKFRPDNTQIKIPHMGWNLANEVRPSLLTGSLPDEPRFYFVHSYYVKAKDEKDVLMKTRYGVDFDSVVQHENIYGAQFHPEKSHKYGMKIFQNFNRITC
ncbi:MAG: imidazole glycerol phosphate synthase subunit HisH [Bacteroidota bacterium]